MLVLPNICNLLWRHAATATTKVGNKSPYPIRGNIIR